MCEDSSHIQYLTTLYTALSCVLLHLVQSRLNQSFGRSDTYAPPVSGTTIDSGMSENIPGSMGDGEDDSLFVIVWSFCIASLILFWTR